MIADILLATFLILWGLVVVLHLPVPPWCLGLLAFVAGILLAVRIERTRS